MNYHLLLLLILGLLASACKKYNPANDKIYPVPTQNNLQSDIALKALEDAINNDLDNAVNFYKKSLIHFSKNEDSLATIYIREALSLDSTQADYWLLQSKLYYRAGFSKIALSSLQKTDLNAKNNLKDLIYIGELFYKQKNYDEALGFLNKSLTIKPLAEAYYWKARIAIARRDSSQAITQLHKVLDQRSVLAEAYNSFAELYLSYDMNKRALSYADSGLAINPDLPLLNYHKAEAFRKRLYYDDSARVYYQKAYELNDSLYLVSYQLGKYEVRDNNFKLAEKYFENTLKYDNTNPQLHYYLGLCYRKLGKKSAAVDQLEIAIEKNPDNYLAKELYWQIKNEILHARMLAREDSIRRAYYQRLAEQEEKRKKELEELRKKQQELYQQQQQQ